MVAERLQCSGSSERHVGDCDTDKLLPKTLVFGLAGRIDLKLSGSLDGLLLAHDRERTRVWEGSKCRICIRGDGDHAASNMGWHVYSMGPANVSNRVTVILDRLNICYDHDDAGLISNGECRELCLALLPVSAVVAIHKPTGTVCLLRDGCGFCCLYYSLQGSSLYFSTSLAGLRDVTQTAAVNTDKIAEMLVFGHQAGNRSIWQGINVVAPGYMVVLRPGSRPRLRSLSFPQCLFDLEERRRLERQPISATIRELETAVDCALDPLQDAPCIAVPGGGGVDSSFLGAFLAKRGRRVTYWCHNQPEAPRREVDWIQPLARALDIPCEVVNIDRQGFLTNLVNVLHQTQQPAMGPNAIGGMILHRSAADKGERILVSGEMCDTLFGGLSAFAYVSRRFRFLNVLARLPHRWRFWIRRGLLEAPTCLHETSQVADGEQLAVIGTGNVERGQLHCDSASFSYPHQSQAQRIADMLTISELKCIPGTLHASFHEMAERIPAKIFYPFAHPSLIRLGIHLPHNLKRRGGHNKWLWRRFTEPYIGKETAFRRKYSFPTLTAKWLDRGRDLLRRGFLEDLLTTDIGHIFDRASQHGPTPWTLLNLELWGRLCVWKESPSSLLDKLL